MKDMFGFLSKIRSKKVLEISLEELNDLIGAHSGRSLSSFEDEAQIIRRNMESVLGQVKNVARALLVGEVGELPDDPSVPVGVSDTTIQRSLSSFSKRLLGLMETISLRPANTFEEIISQRDEVQRLTKAIAQSVMTHRKILSLRFGANLKTITSLVKELDSQLFSLTRLIESNRARFDKFKTVTEEIRSIRMLMTEVEKIEVEIQETRNLLEGLRSEMDRLSQAIETAMSSLESQKELGLKLEVENLRKHISQVEVMLKLGFLDLRKPLAKYLHATQLDKKRETLVQEYLRSPLEAIISDESLGIRETLTELEGQIRTGTVAVKNSEKSIRSLRQIMEKLKDWRDELVLLRRHVADLERLEPSPVTQELEKLRNNRLYLFSEHEKTSSILSQLTRNLEEKQELLEKKVSQVEDESASIVLRPIKIKTQRKIFR